MQGGCAYTDTLPHHPPPPSHPTPTPASSPPLPCPVCSLYSILPLYWLQYVVSSPWSEKAAGAIVISAAFNRKGEGTQELCPFYLSLENCLK